MYDSTNIEDLIKICIEEVEIAHQQKYDADKADRTAALFLEAQLKLSYFMEGIELKSKHLKNEITRIEGVKYFEYKQNSGDKKITETALVQFVAKDDDVVKAKNDHATAEAGFKKFNYILNSLKDGHIFFRTLGKNNSNKWNE